MQHLLQLMLCAMIMQGDLAAAEAPDDDDDEQGRQTADEPLQEAAADQSDTVSSEKPSPHQGLSHEQYKKLKRHKKKNQPAKAHKSEVQFSTSCATCGLDCQSRNKLFAHLKTTGHAALK